MLLFFVAVFHTKGISTPITALCVHLKPEIIERIITEGI
jgi:hypothetical protein